MVLEQGNDVTGAAHAEGAIAPGMLQQAGDAPITYGAELQSIEGLEVPHGEPGGPLSGSSLTGAVPSELGEGGGPDPGPEPVAFAITEPLEGAVVPPVHDIIGVGANPGALVELVHMETQVAVTNADDEGNWGFTGDTPASLGAVTWVARSEGREASVNITVEEPASRSKKGK